MKVICYWNVIVFATISIKLMSKEISQENFNLILDQFLARDFLLTFNIQIISLIQKNQTEGTLRNGGSISLTH